jgi:hypothetical protein
MHARQTLPQQIVCGLSTDVWARPMPIGMLVGRSAFVSQMHRDDFESKLMRLPAKLISLDALYHAYRKAKVDVFYERSQPMVAEFCAYELNLHQNLLALQKRLTRAKASWFQASRTGE